jgi:DNA-directed RNA polymerase specialized sigma24 family protein
VLLERLTPTQRVAFLLREILGFEYSDVASMPRFSSNRRTADEPLRQ